MKNVQGRWLLHIAILWAAINPAPSHNTSSSEKLALLGLPVHCRGEKWKGRAAGMSWWGCPITNGSATSLHCMAAGSSRLVPKMVHRPCWLCIMLSRWYDDHSSASNPSSTTGPIKIHRKVKGRKTTGPLVHCITVCRYYWSIGLSASYLPMDFNCCTDIRDVRKDVIDTRKAEWLQKE